MTMQKKKGAVFFDKDGTLVENIAYNVDSARIRFAPQAGQALERLAAARFELFVVSNQPGIALGLFDATALEEVEAVMCKFFAAHGAKLAAFYFCPHARGSGCDCRKPEPGMLRRAADEFGLDLESSWMIGDILDDVEAGHRAGCQTILLDVGNETEWLSGAGRTPTFQTPSLLSAAEFILCNESQNG